MHYKTNRLNHDFQIIHFIAGSCHTPDAAYAILCDLKEDRLNAIKLFEAGKLREEAKRLRAKKAMQSSDPSEQLEAQADLVEIEALAETTKKNYEAAVAELKTIENCMNSLDPIRKFKHLSPPQAHEAAQEEEWKLELIHRAENCLLTTGTISTDHFATMRLHPAFQSEILPAIDTLRNHLQDKKGLEMILQKRIRYPVPNAGAAYQVELDQKTGLPSSLLDDKKILAISPE